MHALIYENALTGHRGYYVKVLSDALLESGFQLTIMLPKGGMDSTEGQTFLKGLVDDANIQELSVGASSGGLTAKQRYAMLAESCQRVQPDHVFVPYADGISQKWGMTPFPQKLGDATLVAEGLMMRGGFAYPTDSWKQKMYYQVNRFLVTRSRWDRIHCLDPLVYLNLKETKPSFAQRVVLIPEPVESCDTTREQAMDILGIRPTSKVICCPGMLDKRKGIDLLIKAFALAANEVDAQLLLYGPHAPEIQSLLAEEFSDLVRSQKVLSTDKFANPAEFNALFAISDLICAPYPRHIGSASVLIKAARNGNNILASNWGWVGWATREFGLGATCDVRDTESFAAALQKAITNETVETRRNELKEQFISYHTLENFVAHFTAKLHERANIPVRPMIDFPFPIK